MSKIEKAVDIYMRGGVIALFFATWAHIGNVVYSNIDHVPVISYLLGVIFPTQPGKSIFTPAIDYLKYILFNSDTEFQRTKLRNKSIYVDRFIELYNFFESRGKTRSSFLWFYLQNGLPHTLYYEYRFSDENKKYFGEDDYSPNSQELLKGYKAIEFWTANRLMLAYDRYEIGKKFLELTNKDAKSINVLDYGCGVADPDIYLGLMGADVTIVDLDTVVIELAEYRLRTRDIEFTAYATKQTENPINMDEQKVFDFIIMSEFLEHVRNPKVYLEFVIENLEEGGYFFDSVGRNFTHEIHDQHLKEAKETVMSKEYQRLHHNYFEHVSGNFYRKKYKNI